LRKKVLILGATGLIGHQIYNYLEKYSSYDLYNISYRKKLNDKTVIADVREENKFISLVSEINPDVIINAIGILINGSTKDPENAIFINAYIPHRLSRVAKSIDAKLVHISTDCVFSGFKMEPYIESDDKDGKDTYAKTKGLGEVINERDVTLRTSVIGPELKSDGEELFHWFMSQKGTVNGFTKAIWSGVTTLELAKAVYWAIEDDINGLYHITNNSYINKYDLLELIKKYMQKDIDIVAVDGKKVYKNFRDTRKEREYKIPTYEIMVQELATLIFENKTLYKQYLLDNSSE